MIGVMVGEVQLRTKITILIENKLENFNIDPTLKWEKAEIIELNPNILSLQNEKGENIKIYKSDLN